MCCNYGPDGMAAASHYDCVLIPNAEKAAAPSTALAFNALCGRLFVTAKGAVAATICCKHNYKKITN